MSVEETIFPPEPDSGQDQGSSQAEPAKKSSMPLPPIYTPPLQGGQTKLNERSFTGPEVSDILTQAHFRHLSAQKKPLEEILGRPIGKISEGTTTVESIVDIAKQLGIPLEHVKREIQSRYPSEQEQLAAISLVGATPSREVVRQIYETAIFEALSREYPRGEFIRGSSTYPWEFEVYQVERNRKRRWIMGDKEVVTKKLLANFSFRSDVCSDYHDPKFLHACAKTIELLDKKFSPLFDGFNNRYTYILQ